MNTPATGAPRSAKPPIGPDAASRSDAAVGRSSSMTPPTRAAAPPAAESHADATSPILRLAPRPTNAASTQSVTEDARTTAADLT